MNGIKFFWQKYREQQLTWREFLVVCYWWLKHKRNREQIRTKVIEIE